jgi:hypothetical protein
MMCRAWRDGTQGGHGANVKERGRPHESSLAARLERVPQRRHSKWLRQDEVNGLRHRLSVEDSIYRACHHPDQYVGAPGLGCAGDVPPAHAGHPKIRQDEIDRWVDIEPRQPFRAGRGFNGVVACRRDHLRNDLADLFLVVNHQHAQRPGRMRGRRRATQKV